MAIVSTTHLTNEFIDSLIAATDEFDVARQFGYADGLAGKDQCGSAYFPANTPAWHSYNDGYRAGTLVFVASTGKTRRCILGGHRRLVVQTIDALNPFGSASQGDDNS